MTRGVTLLLIALGVGMAGCKDDPEPTCTVDAACDDGDANTTDDVYDADCVCAGTPIEACASGDADADGVCTDVDCDDADAANTAEDADADGVCTPEDCDDADGAVFPGASCDDGDAATENDAYDDSCVCVGGVPAEFYDPRDGKWYAQVPIGDQLWMAQGLDFEPAGTRCYEDDPANCTEYGRLYDWTTALTACPAGWHLPTEADFTTLVEGLGGEDVAGGKLKATGTLEDGTGLWTAPNEGATNESGFNGVPGGYWDFAGYYDFRGDLGAWWSAAEVDGYRARVLRTRSWEATADFFSADKEDSYPIRCVHD